MQVPAPFLVISLTKDGACFLFFNESVGFSNRAICLSSLFSPRFYFLIFDFHLWDPSL